MTEACALSGEDERLRVIQRVCGVGRLRIGGGDALHPKVRYGVERRTEGNLISLVWGNIHSCVSSLRRRGTIVDDSIDSRIHLADAEVLGFRYNETVWLRILTV